MRFLKHLLKPAIGLLVILILIKKGGLDPALVAQAFRNHPGFLAAGFFIYTALATLGGYRWFLLVKCVGIQTRFSTIFSLHMIGLFFVTLLPGGTGGDVVKGYYVYRDTPSQKGLALTSVVMDRLVGVYALLCLGILGTMINFEMAFNHPSLSWNSWFYLGTFLTATLMVGLFFTPFALKALNHSLIEKLPGKKMLRGLFDAIQVYRAYPGTLLVTVLMTLVIHGGLLFMCYFAALSLKVDLPLVKHAFVVPLITIINGIPISPAGIGVGEAAAYKLYDLMGVSRGGEILALWHVFVIVLALMGAPFYFFYKKKR